MKCNESSLESRCSWWQYARVLLDTLVLICPICGLLFISSGHLKYNLYNMQSWLSTRTRHIKKAAKCKKVINLKDCKNFCHLKQWEKMVNYVIINAVVLMWSCSFVISGINRAVDKICSLPPYVLTETVSNTTK